jgi:hypothetical protein
LRKYVPAAARQKQTKAMTVSVSATRVSSTPAAPGAANTRTFLTHCFGRARRSSAIGSDGGGGAAAEPGTSMVRATDRAYRPPSSDPENTATGGS